MISLFSKKNRHSYNKQRLVTPGIQSELPRFFANYLWNYVDSLSLETRTLDKKLYFDVSQEKELCRVHFHQDLPKFSDEITLHLFQNEELLPAMIIVDNARDKQTMYLPNETY